MDSFNEIFRSHSAGLVNIPKTVVDGKYRYTRPISEIHHEGRGGAARTVIKNLPAIAKALHRPPEYVLQYCSVTKGATIKVDKTNKMYFIKGTLSVAEIEDLIEGFIARFVLCTKDRNPETDIRRKKPVGSQHKDEVKLYLCCASCGHSSRIQDEIKMTRFIVTTYDTYKVVLQAHAEKYRAAVKKTANAPIANTATKDEWDTDWSADTSQAAVDERRAELLGMTLAEARQSLEVPQTVVANS